ncbi:hypothetical protein RND71_026528 [Anisodus tanguticus]|uniref:FH2 domain-containing protein n=1 Tax=Anisodus tanguticus TaxID=243964 RepID=A0AAE1RNF4_9SOLA|nr:hypothetical protein RND71_026528 [Anisodus tanguticus]
MLDVAEVLASMSPALLDFHKDLASVEAASKIQLKSLAEEMQAIINGQEKVKKELEASQTDGPVFESFCKHVISSTGDAKVNPLLLLHTLASSLGCYHLVGPN